MRRRPEKKQSAGCPQWILEGVRAIRLQAITSERRNDLHAHQGSTLVFANHQRDG